MKILFIRHASFEKPGFISEWAEKHGYETETLCPFRGEQLPTNSNFDFLIVLGGPQSVLRLDNDPYLYDEIKLIQQTIKENKPVLGICLGAQLIGVALGAVGAPSPYREIGIYPITLLAAAKDDPIFAKFPAQFPVMHWHSDMPGLTKDAVLLAESAGCPRQIIRYTPKVYRLQCHFEFNTEVVERILGHVNDDSLHGEYVQSRSQLLALDFSAINQMMEKILDYYVTLI